MGIYRIKMNGKTYEMEVEFIGESEPKAISRTKPEKVYEPPKPAIPSVTEEHLEPGVVVAPMSGRIIEIVAKTGEAIEEGDTVLILEAMKMENEITAPKTGILEALYVSDGQAVGGGEALFKIV